MIAEELGFSSFSVLKWALDAAGRADPVAVNIDEQVARLRREKGILREDAAASSKVKISGGLLADACINFVVPAFSAG